MLSRTRFVLGPAMVFAIMALTAMSGSQAQHWEGTASGGSSAGLITSVPRTMTYQGILKDGNGNPLPDSTVDITFRIYNDPTVGDQLWENVIAIITDDGGYFNASLVDLNLPFDEDYYLELQIVGDTQPLEPRQMLHMAPYSAYAIAGAGWVDDGAWVRLETSSDKVGIGIPVATSKLHVEGFDSQYPILNVVQNGSSEAARFYSGHASALWVEDAHDHGLEITNAGGSGVYVQNAGADGIRVDNAVGWAGYFDGPGYFSGDVGIGRIDPSEKLDVAGTAQIAGFKMPTGASNGYVLTSDVDGAGTWQAAAGGIDGSGTANYVPKFTASSTLGNSDIYEVAGDVGIGTTSPSEKLDVVGNIHASATISSGIISSGSSIIIDGVNDMIIASNDTIDFANANLFTTGKATIGPGHTNAGVHAFVAGENNATAGNYSTVCGGNNNTASDNYSTVAGGRNNTASGYVSFAAGHYNTASGSCSFATGFYNTAFGNRSFTSGHDNIASGHDSFAAGSDNTAAGNCSFATGRNNTASGNYSFAAGHNNTASEHDSFAAGSYNTASGINSFAAGHNAKAMHSGTFVWADGSPVDFVSTDDDQFLIRAEEGVGIGTTNPGYQLDVAGYAHASSFPTSSDKRLKKNVKQLKNTLEKLEKIQGVSFEWNELYESLGRSTGHKEIGVIAQEIQAVFPELITTWGDENYMAVDYGRLTGVLIEAVKELKVENEVIKQQTIELEHRIVELERNIR